MYQKYLYFEEKKDFKNLVLLIFFTKPDYKLFPILYQVSICFN